MKVMNRLQSLNSFIHTNVLCRRVSQRSSSCSLLATSPPFCPLNGGRRERGGGKNSKSRVKTELHVKGKETSSKVPTSCTATEPFLPQSCHGFWSILSSYCESRNSGHHLLSCLSRHLANICQIDGFFQTPL